MTRTVLAALLVSACADDAGPLDRETIAEIAKSRGDAHGGARTGVYLASFEYGDCDCSDEIGIPLCLSQELADVQLVELRIVEGDGFLTAAIDASQASTMSGAIDTDGTATLGSVQVGSGLGAGLVVLTRLDGEFDEHGMVTGTAQQAARGELGGASISCGGTFEVAAFRLF